MHLKYSTPASNKDASVCQCCHSKCLRRAGKRRDVENCCQQIHSCQCQPAHWMRTSWECCALSNPDFTRIDLPCPRKKYSTKGVPRLMRAECRVHVLPPSIIVRNAFTGTEICSLSSSQHISLNIKLLPSCVMLIFQGCHWNISLNYCKNTILVSFYDWKKDKDYLACDCELCFSSSFCKRLLPGVPFSGNMWLCLAMDAEWRELCCSHRVHWFSLLFGMATSDVQQGYTLVSLDPWRADMNKVQHFMEYILSDKSLSII